MANHQKKLTPLTDIAKNSPMEIEVSLLENIEKELVSRGNLSSEMARLELEWFCTKLGMGDYYFRNTSYKEIAKHIETIRAAEIISENSSDAQSFIDLKSEDDGGALYILTDNHALCLQTEEKIEKRYSGFILECYKTTGKTRMGLPLRVYKVSTPKFQKPNWKPGDTFEDGSDRYFLDNALPQSVERYKSLWQKSADKLGPEVAISRDSKAREIRLMVSLDEYSGRNFLSRFSEVIDSFKIFSNRKYRFPFANGRVIYTFYFDEPNEGDIIERLANDVTLISLMPDGHPLSEKLKEGTFTTEETLFAMSAAAFTNQFMTTYNEDYTSIARALKNEPEALGFLTNFKTRLAKDTYTNTKIAATVAAYPTIVKAMYETFSEKFLPSKKIRKHENLMAGVEKMVAREVGNHIEKNILLTFMNFISHTLKTNFYKKDKVSLCFRLNPFFLSPIDYPEIPHGLFFLFSREFLGFHVRFRDIARGGIRLIKSRTSEIYARNLETVFDENYSLASTQQKKNKDIPEGGSKGTVLLDYKFPDRGELAFKKYISGLLDLLIKDGEVVDYLQKEEFLFLGPDEGTADFMPWASQYANQRGYKFPMAFTTGKPLDMGGIPHDMFGVTTKGVHQFVLGVLAKHNLKETEITKFQTGGPDGDLGSNEILISKDKTIAIVDGSGVAYDPNGLKREELNRLAKNRIPIENFDPTKLSKGGFLVKISDKEIKLPNGQIVPNGEEFRNNFHLTSWAKADLFLPCGGRPKAININNWNQVIKGGEPLWKFIIEGANLFVTQEARLRLEEHGIALIKDASANKGGVTSSSLEVLVSMGLSPEEYQELLVVKPGMKPTPFRESYVADVVDRICQNADLEFHALYQEHQRSKIPMSIISDQLSNKINKVTDDVAASDIFEDKKLFKKVLQRMIPKPLVDQVGIDKLAQRIPVAYTRAMVATGLAQDYIYRFGIGSSEVEFYNFLRNY